MFRGFAVLNDQVISVNNVANRSYKSWKKANEARGAVIQEIDRPGSPWGVPSALKVVTGKILEKTAEEIFERQQVENKLWADCKAYEAANIYPETLAELDKSERAVETGQAVEADLPKAAELGAFRQVLWGLPTDAPDANGSYFAQKNSISADTLPSGDFSSSGRVSIDFVDIRAERKTFLASR